MSKEFNNSTTCDNCKRLQKMVDEYEGTIKNLLTKVDMQAKDIQRLKDENSSPCEEIQSNTKFDEDQLKEINHLRVVNKELSAERDKLCRDYEELLQEKEFYIKQRKEIENHVDILYTEIKELKHTIRIVSKYI